VAKLKYLRDILTNGNSILIGVQKPLQQEIIAIIQFRAISVPASYVKDIKDYRVVAMAYNAQNHWIYGLRPSSGILNSVSGIGSVYVFR
jgi:hypothetical protein